MQLQLIMTLVTAAVAAATDICGTTATPLSPFNTTQYLGIWYQIALDDIQFVTTEKNYPRCVYANYTLNSNGTVDVINQGYNAKDERNVAHAIGTQPTPNVAHLTIQFDNGASAPYNVVYVINDDKNRYKIAVVFVCLDFLESMFILSRTPTISNEENQKIMAFAEEAHINVKRLRLQYTDQRNCTYHH